MTIVDQEGVWKDPPVPGLFETWPPGNITGRVMSPIAIPPSAGWSYVGSFVSELVRMDCYYGGGRSWGLVFCQRATRRILESVEVHSWYGPPWRGVEREERIVAKYLKKAEAAARKSPKRKVDPYFAEKFEALHEFLVLTEWEDKSPRETGTLTLFVDQGQWKARLNDRDGGLVVFLAAEGYIALLEALEAGLREGTLDWRVDKFASARSKKKA